MRLDDDVAVDHFYFSVFHGGSGPRWGPQRDSVVYLDNFWIGAPPPAE